jgi:hypothetical protein
MHDDRQHGPHRSDVAAHGDGDSKPRFSSGVPSATRTGPPDPELAYGVDSVHAISLVGDVEAHFEIDVDPTMIFDYPTLSHLAEYIDTAVTEREEAVA